MKTALILAGAIALMLIFMESPVSGCQKFLFSGDIEDIDWDQFCKVAICETPTGIPGISSMGTGGTRRARDTPGSADKPPRKKADEETTASSDDDE